MRKISKKLIVLGAILLIFTLTIASTSSAARIDEVQRSPIQKIYPEGGFVRAPLTPLTPIVPPEPSDEKLNLEETNIKVQH